MPKISQLLRSQLPLTTEVIITHFLEYLRTTHLVYLNNSIPTEQFINTNNYETLYCGAIRVGSVQLYHASGFAIILENQANIHYFNDDNTFLYSKERVPDNQKTTTHISDPNCLEAIEKFLDSCISRIMNGNYNQ